VVDLQDAVIFQLQTARIVAAFLGLVHGSYSNSNAYVLRFGIVLDLRWYFIELLIVLLERVFDWLLLR
jgi:hypothetical protein